MKYFDFPDCSISYSVQGQGEYIFLIHGFPTNSKTWRFMVPQLSMHYQTIVMDLPGLGESKFNDKVSLNIREQAARLVIFISSFGCHSFSIIAHNSGGAIARLVVLNMQKKVKKLILINTEIPNHRPPWIPFYQKITKFPFANRVLKLLISFDFYNQSSMGFKELYFNKTHLKGEYLKLYLVPLKKSLNKVNGAIKFLQGIDWEIIDDFRVKHRNIKANTLLLWGENDQTFPLQSAVEMKNQLKQVKLVAISESCLLPHEEKPLECLEIILKFLKYDD